MNLASIRPPGCTAIAFREDGEPPCLAARITLIRRIKVENELSFEPGLLFARQRSQDANGSKSGGIGMRRRSVPCSRTKLGNYRAYRRRTVGGANRPS